jgi:hypothetical protein
MAGSIKLTRADKKALSGRADLVRRFEEAVERLEEADSRAVLRSFQALLSKGKVAVNMSIPRLVRFLEEGQWSNIFEAVSRETGLKGAELDQEVARRLGEFAAPCRRLGGLFGFRRDTHYAYLNLGGAGAQGCGICCVILDICRWPFSHTCFAGDSISSLRYGREALRSFVPGPDWERLAVIKYEPYIKDNAFCIDPVKLRKLVESRDSSIEFHLHGPVTREMVSGVMISRGSYEKLDRLADGMESSSDARDRRSDKIGYFRKLLRLLEQYGIPLTVAERGSYDL